MSTSLRVPVLAAVVIACLGAASQAAEQKKQAAAAQKKMSFFVTSVGSGKGADLGGLAGADQHCQALAKAVGAGNRTWRAYLSTTASGSAKAVNARDRIGRGPWYNVKGELIARNVDELHTDNHISSETALTEKGDKPILHDMLTGSDTQGRAHPVSEDTTCRNWTSSGAGAAQLGHSDRRGTSDNPPARSWNMAHPSIGCSPDALRKTGGAGLFYCFAAK